jgi:hypothetical protein
VFLNDTSLPRLKLSRAYREIARDKAKFKGENKEFISNKLNSANWMIQAIEQRRQTMLKVMNFIVDRQREFFEKGVQYLKPLTLREVAEVINMHESTVSRVTNEKFVQTGGVCRFGSSSSGLDRQEDVDVGIGQDPSWWPTESGPLTDGDREHPLTKAYDRRRTVAVRDQLGSVRPDALCRAPPALLDHVHGPQRRGWANLTGPAPPTSRSWCQPTTRGSLPER